MVGIEDIYCWWDVEKCVSNDPIVMEDMPLNLDWQYLTVGVIVLQLVILLLSLTFWVHSHRNWFLNTYINRGQPETMDDVEVKRAMYELTRRILLIEAEKEVPHPLEPCDEIYAEFGITLPFLLEKDSSQDPVVVVDDAKMVDETCEMIYEEAKIEGDTCAEIGEEPVDELETREEDDKDLFDSGTTLPETTQGGIEVITCSAKKPLKLGSKRKSPSAPRTPISGLKRAVYPRSRGQLAKVDCRQNPLKCPEVKPKGVVAKAKNRPALSPPPKMGSQTKSARELKGKKGNTDLLASKKCKPPTSATKTVKPKLTENHDADPSTKPTSSSSKAICNENHTTPSSEQILSELKRTICREDVSGQVLQPFHCRDFSSDVQLISYSSEQLCQATETSKESFETCTVLFEAKQGKFEIKVYHDANWTGFLGKDAKHNSSERDALCGGDKFEEILDKVNSDESNYETCEDSPMIEEHPCDALVEKEPDSEVGESPPPEEPEEAKSNPDVHNKDECPIVEGPDSSCQILSAESMELLNDVMESRLRAGASSSCYAVRDVIRSRQRSNISLKKVDCISDNEMYLSEISSDESFTSGTSRSSTECISLYFNKAPMKKSVTIMIPCPAKDYDDEMERGSDVIKSKSDTNLRDFSVKAKMSRSTLENEKRLSFEKYMEEIRMLASRGSFDLQ